MSQFLSQLSLLFGRKPGPRKRPVRQQPLARFVPSFDTLEDRLTPASSASSTFAVSTDTLTITAKDITTGITTPAQLAANNNDLTILGTSANGTGANSFIIAVDAKSTAKCATTGTTTVLTSDTSNFTVNDLVAGANIPANDTVLAIILNTSITLSAAASSTVASETLLDIAPGGGTLDTKQVEAFATVKNIILNLGAGNDSVTVQNSTLTGTLTFNGANGNNKLYIDGQDLAPAVGNTIGNVVVKNGIGDNYIGIGNGTNAITGNLTITNGNGYNVVSLGTEYSVSHSDDLTIGGSLTITNGIGKNVIQAAPQSGFDTGGTAGNILQVGAVTIKNGNGNDFIALDFATSLTTGAISITNGVGNHDIDFGYSYVNAANSVNTGNITITNGTGDMFLFFGAEGNNTDTTTVITGNLKVTNAGYGDVEMSDAGSGSSFKVTGTTTISNGVGDSNIEFEADTVKLLGATTITNGAGENAVEFDNGSTTMTVGNLTITNGAGTTEVLFEDATTMSLGTVKITNGAGENEVEFEQNTNMTLGSFTVTDGAGASDTNLEAGSGGATVTGNVSITTGTGEATVDVEGFSAAKLLTVTGSVTISKGVGESFIDVESATIGTAAKSNLSIKSAGGGDDEVEIETATVTGATTVSLGNGNGSVYVSGSNLAALTITAAAGGDEVDLESDTMTGATTVTLGNGGGESDFTVNNSHLAAFTLTTGDGNDQVNIATDTASAGGGPTTTFSGIVSVNTGAGDDTVTLGNATGGNTQTAQFNGTKTTFNGGADLDTLNLAQTNFAPPTSAFVATGFELIQP